MYDVDKQQKCDNGDYLKKVIKNSERLGDILKQMSDSAKKEIRRGEDK